MKLYPRSYWTSQVPRPSTVGDQFIGLPYFTAEPTGIEFHPVGKDLLYVYRNPATELNLLLKEAVQGTGVSDIDFNYAIAQNVRGAYTLRGGGTKCRGTEAIKVLLLIGTNEKPTDVLKENQAEFSLNFTNFIPTPPLHLGDANVHVFDLIEYLIERGYYHARNDGIYGPLVQHAVSRLQLELELPTMHGDYDEWLYSKLKEEHREYIKLEKSLIG